MIVVPPYFIKAVIFGLTGIVPLDMLRYNETAMVCAFIVRSLHKAGFNEKVVLVVPVDESTPD